MAKKNEEKAPESQPEQMAQDQQANRQARQGNPDQNQEQHFVEYEDAQGNKQRALSTPAQQAVYHDLPEGADTVGLLEAQARPYSDEEERDRQQLENYPRKPEEYFDPHEDDARDAEPLKAGRASTARADHGRVVVVDHDVLHDGEVYKGGTQDLPADIADALIGRGVAWEPAGKKKGR